MAAQLKFHSTNKKSPRADFKQVLMQGLASDGGLFIPAHFSKMRGLIQMLRTNTNATNTLFHKIALEVSKKFIQDIPEKDFKKIIKDAFNFEVPLRQLDDNLYILELWHGPTLAFKDFGARFMARVMNYYLSEKGNPSTSSGNKAKSGKLNIITATSGDTGSAVASGFYGLSNIEVFILYPSRRVTLLQEKQMATLGKNIVALEVKGNFDDCQKLAKQILSDEDLKKKINLSSANSINFGRLLPQSFYYFYGYTQFLRSNVIGQMSDVVFCVPSGNFGNLTAGLMAKCMGLPVKQFIAATNANDVVPWYLKTGKFVSRVSRKTISNAMDVGNPSNFVRMLKIYNYDHKKMAKDIIGISINDKQTRETIKNVYQKTGYILDPHTAVGVAAALKSNVSQPIIVLGTAHPAKFKEIVEPVIGKKVPLPSQLKAIKDKKKKSILMKNDLNLLKSIILS